MSELARDTGLTRKEVRKSLAPCGNRVTQLAKMAKAQGFRLALAPVDEVLSKSQDLTP